MPMGVQFCARLPCGRRAATAWLRGGCEASDSSKTARGASDFRQSSEMSGFVGGNLRLIRLFYGLSLTDLGEQVSISKQFLSRVETGAESVAPPLENSLAERLN